MPSERQYVAIKISVSTLGEQNREVFSLHRLAASGSNHPGAQHVTTMLDHFQIAGPNGTHKCVVLELLGPNLPSLLHECLGDERFPGNLAKQIAKQALLGLDYLHEQGMGHGGGPSD